MKKRSGTSGGARKQPEPVFFTDRDLGKAFPAFLRAHGLRVEPYHEHFESPTVADVTWIEYVGRHGWVAISHDAKQTIRPEERDALMAHRVRAFYVIGAAPYGDLALAFVAAIDEVRALLQRSTDPFIAKVYRVTPSQPRRVRLALTYSQWLKRRR